VSNPPQKRPKHLVSIHQLDRFWNTIHNTSTPSV